MGQQQPARQRPFIPAHDAVTKLGLPATLTAGQTILVCRSSKRFYRLESLGSGAGKHALMHSRKLGGRSGSGPGWSWDATKRLTDVETGEEFPHHIETMAELAYYFMSPRLMGTDCLWLGEGI